MARRIAGYLIDGPEEIEASWLQGKQRIGVTAGASAPEILVQRVVDRISHLAGAEVSQAIGVEERFISIAKRTRLARRVTGGRKRASSLNLASIDDLNGPNFESWLPAYAMVFTARRLIFSRGWLDTILPKRKRGWLMKRSSGFTLMELMIVVAIVVLLAAIALPSYQSYVVRAHRAAAKAQMLEIAAREQQYFLANRAYGDLSAIGFSIPPDVSARYTCSATPGTLAVPSYSISCVPVATTTQSGDGTLTLDNLGNKGPVGKW